MNKRISPLLFLFFLGFLIVPGCTRTPVKKTVSMQFHQNDIPDFQKIENVKKILERERYVEKVTIEGDREAVLIIDISKKHIMRMALSYGEVRKAIAGEFTQPYPFIEQKEKSIILFKMADLDKMIKYKDNRSFGDMPVRVIDGGGTIRLSDIARIEQRYMLFPVNKNGIEMVIIHVRIDSTNEDKLKEELKNLRARYKLKYQLSIQ
ncbi:MAG: efflux RND transporter permease subunit [bacterium]|nr:efflux RND transporter permease subunit [bacterium]